MKINKEVIKKLNPCTNRYKNFLENYPDFDGTDIEFLNLENITYEDKVWVCRRILDREILISWAVKCAESVLYIFENKYPQDDRPRKAIEAIKNKLPKEEIRRAAYDAAAAADAAASYAAAYTAYTAAYAAYADADAAADAAYAYDAAAAYADAAAADAADRKTQIEKNIRFLIEAINEKV